MLMAGSFGGAPRWRCYYHGENLHEPCSHEEAGTEPYANERKRRATKSQAVDLRTPSQRFEDDLKKVEQRINSSSPPVFNYLGVGP